MPTHSKWDGLHTRHLLESAHTNTHRHTQTHTHTHTNKHRARPDKLQLHSLQNAARAHILYLSDLSIYLSIYLSIR